jgi:hypothetical protein
MKRIAVLSDTHEDDLAIEMFINCMESSNIQEVIHLGDYFDDASVLKERGFKLIQVPGTWDESYYRDSNVENRKLIKIENWRIFLTHTPESHYNDLREDPKPEHVLGKSQADIMLFGHTHLAGIQRRNGTVLINPGHLNSYEGRGCPLTYAILEIEKDRLNVKIMQLPENQVRIKKSFRRGPDRHIEEV